MEWLFGLCLIGVVLLIGLYAGLRSKVNELNSILATYRTIASESDDRSWKNQTRVYALENLAHKHATDIALIKEHVGVERDDKPRLVEKK